MFAVLAFLLLSACSSGSDDERLFAEEDLPQIVRGQADAPEGLLAAKYQSGPRTLGQIAKESERVPDLNVDRKRLRRLGFVAARVASFPGGPSAAFEGAILFGDAIGATGS